MRLSLFALFSLLLSPLTAQFLFQGRAPEQYHGKMVHLDIIDGWNDFRLIADDQLLLEAPVDSQGNYRIVGHGLPAGLGYYRLRFRDSATEGAVSMYYRRRHFIYFLAGPMDTLSFDGLTSVNAGPTNALINRVSREIDRLNEERSRAETGRMVKLIEDKQGRLLSGEFTADNAAAGIFLLGNWPEEAVPTDLLEELEDQLGNEEGIRSIYLASLKAEIGARSIDSLRWQIGKYRLLLGLALLIILGLTVIAWYRRSNRIVDGERGVGVTTSPELSPKEEEVITLIFEGRSNKEIASRLFISPATVKSHINNIYRKAGIRTRKEAIALGAQLKSTPV